MEQITNTISKISKIEEQASLILQQAVTDKKQYSIDIEQWKKEFDSTLLEQNTTEITKIRNELKSNMSSALCQQREDTLSKIAEMQKEFDRNHSSIANMILKSMIGA